MEVVQADKEVKQEPQEALLLLPTQHGAKMLAVLAEVMEITILMAEPEVQVAEAVLLQHQHLVQRQMKDTLEVVPRVEHPLMQELEVAEQLALEVKEAVRLVEQEERHFLFQSQDLLSIMAAEAVAE